MFFKNPTKSQLPARIQNAVLFMVGFFIRDWYLLGVFPARKKVTVVYCHLWCVRKLVSACSGEMRHWWFGLFALLQEMWLTCGSLILALSPASSCKCRGCDGVCAKSHCKTWHKECAQDDTEDRGEAGRRVQVFVSSNIWPHTGTRNCLSISAVQANKGTLKG